MMLVSVGAEGGARRDGTMDDPDGWDLGVGDDGTESAPVDHTPSADDPTADDDFAREVLAAQERRDWTNARIPVQRFDTLGDPRSDDDANDDEDEDDDDEDEEEDHGGWDDFSIKTPWERAVHNVESVVRRWLRLSDEDLAAQSSRCARPEHGGRDLRCLRTLIHHKMDHFRPDPYAVILYYPKHNPPNVFFRLGDRPDAVASREPSAPARALLTHRFYCDASEDNAGGTSGIQRWLGVGCPFIVVEPPASYSRCFSGGDETATVVSAVNIALVNTAAPSCWAIVAPTGGPSRGAFLGRAGGITKDAGGWGMKIETDSLAGVVAEKARGRSLAGLAKTLEETLEHVDWDRATRERMAKARATARLTFPTNRRWAADRAKLEKRKKKKSLETGAGSDGRRDGTGWGDGDGWGFSSDGSDSDSDEARPGAAFMALAGGQRVRGFGKKGASSADKKGGSESDGSDFGITLNEWDDEAPWAPWAALDDPWESVELDACWVDAPLDSLVDRDYIYLGGSGSEDEDSDEERRRERRDGKDLLEPEKAPLWTLRAVPTGAFREDGSDGMAGELSAAAKRFDLGAGIFSESSRTSNSFYDNKGDVDGRDDGPGGVGMAEMLWLFASAGGVRAAPGADTMSRLASPEYWDEVASRYDVDDGFGVGAPPRVPPESVVQDVLRDVFDTGGHRRDPGRKAPAKSPETGAEAANEANDDEKCRMSDPEALFPTPQKSAPPDSLLARVALHAMQFGNVRAVAILWQRFVREVRFAHWDRGVPLPRMDDSSSGETVPDVLACAMHQKLQMINACIHRRKARAEAEFAESGVSKLGPTPLAGSVMQSAIVSQDSTGAQAWEDATGDGWGDAEDDVWNDAHAKDAKGGNEWADPDDDIDLTSMIGGAIADKTTKTGAEGTKTDEKPSADEPVRPEESAGDDALDETRSEEYGSASDGETDGGWRWDDGDVDGDPDAPPEGVKGEMPGGLRMLRPPHRRMAEPIAQLPPLYTEDMMREREAALSALGDTEDGRAIRLKMQSDMLVSDMSAFKAANPGSCLADFVRWHSPRDWISDEEGDERVRKGSKSPLAPTGRLSERMRNEGNAWRTLWRDSPRLPASRQKPLFDPIKEGEKALHHLEQAPPPEIFAQLCAAATAAVGSLYARAKGATLAPCPQYLARAAEVARAVLNNSRGSPATENDYASLAGELQRAERCVARGEALRHRLPGVSARLLEEVLRVAAADEERRDEHNATVAEKKKRAAAAAAAAATRSPDARAEHPPVVRDDGGDRDGGDDDDAEGRAEDEEALERLRSRPVEVSVLDGEREPLARLLPPDLERLGARSASCAEYAVRCGGGVDQIQRAHALAAPCFTRVSSAIAYQY